MIIFAVCVVGSSAMPTDGLIDNLRLVRATSSEASVSWQCLSGKRASNLGKLYDKKKVNADNDENIPNSGAYVCAVLFVVRTV